MWRSAWTALVFLNLFACGKETEPLPLEEDKLVEVLADVHVAEAALQHLAGPIKDSTAALYYEQVFTIHGVEEADFDTAVVRLRDDPDRLREIYARVLARLDSTRLSTEAGGS